ncbi:MAG: hypothetical protein K6E22_01505 [Treponema sp.]|nr:hypothetical protein [Treponema sp.]
MKDISMDKIIGEIKSEIKAHCYKESGFYFFDEKDVFNHDIVFSNIVEATSNSKISMYSEVSGGILKQFFKKLIRKIVRPSFYGQIEKQEKFNASVVAVLYEMEKTICTLENKLEQLKRD